MENRDKKILVVDDEESIRNVLHRVLKGEGYDVRTASTGDEALARLAEEPADLVLSDIRMPGMDGMALLSRLAENGHDLSVIMVTSVQDVETAIKAMRLGAVDYIVKPFNLDEIDIAVERAIEVLRLRRENASYQRELEDKVLLRTAELREALARLDVTYGSTLEALVNALDAREHETQSHSQRVRAYTLRLAAPFPMSDPLRISLGHGALLHDIGKIGVSDAILLKPAKLTPEEWVEMRKHPQIGFDILSGIDFLRPAAEIVLAHQERFDGTGYPRGLAGDNIPLGARIFPVVDTLDAMTSDRPYRKALPYERAFEEIRTYSGRQFDHEVVEAFFSIPSGEWPSIRARFSGLSSPRVLQAH